jgi:hypothetical protein
VKFVHDILLLGFQSIFQIGLLRSQATAVNAKVLKLVWQLTLRAAGTLVELSIVRLGRCGTGTLHIHYHV